MADSVPVTAGVLTSEFWIAVLPIAFMLLDKVGILHVPADSQTQLATTIATAITSILYIHSRTSIKTAAINAQSSATQAVAGAPTA